MSIKDIIKTLHAEKKGFEVECVSPGRAVRWLHCYADWGDRVVKIMDDGVVFDEEGNSNQKLFVKFDAMLYVSWSGQ